MVSQHRNVDRRNDRRKTKKTRTIGEKKTNKKRNTNEISYARQKDSKEKRHCSEICNLKWSMPGKKDVGCQETNMFH